MTDWDAVDARNRELRDWGEEAPPIDAQLRDAASWMLAAELVRRHPGQLVIDHAVPIEGVGYIGLGVFEARPVNERRMVAFIPQTPKYHPTAFDEGPITDDRPNWPHFVLSSDRQRIIEDLERRCRLDPPASTPSTTSSTISYRIIARFMERAALRSSVSKPRRWTFVQRSQVAACHLDPPGSDLRMQSGDGREASASYWCLLELDARAIDGLEAYDSIPAWLDTSAHGAIRAVHLMVHDRGHVILASHEQVDLMWAYRESNRRLDPVVNRVFPSIV